LNSRETRLFSKSNNLYALNLANDALREIAKKDKTAPRRLTIVEGYTDVIAAHQNGLKNVVAALGTALNENHIRLIKRFADGITLVLDGDDAGQRRANEVLDIFVEHDVDLRILTLPEGVDPFDFVMNSGGNAFQEIIDAAPDAIAHKVEKETRGIDLINDSHRANQALESVLKTLARVPVTRISQSAAKSMRQEQILMRLSRQFQLDTLQVKRRLAEIRVALSPNLTPQDQLAPDAQPALDFSRFRLTESALIQLLITEPELLDRAVENISPQQFVEGILKQVYEFLVECFHDGKDVGYDALMLDLENPIYKNVIAYLYDQAISKNDSLKGQSHGFQFEPESQLTTIIERFNESIDLSGKIAQISKLQSKQLNEQEEQDTLSELFLKQLERFKKQ
ncbi:MAG: toprim domain-containing protein, partial [Planctomycetota bacterium]